MQELTEIVKLITDIGVPTLFFAIAFLLLFKYLPAWKKDDQETKLAMQRSYDERNKVFSDQMSIIIKVAEQGNQVIARSNEVIGMATDAIRQNTEIHDKVSSALSRDLLALQTLSSDLKIHDRRAEQINVAVEKLLDRTDY